MTTLAPDALADLNEEQRAAVLHGDDPLVLVAGAGSGKTTTLAARVARLVLDGADPRRILLVTFSRRAAAELARRTALRVHQALRLPPGPAALQLPWCGTFHGVAARLLREHAAALGLSPDFSVLDRADAEELLAQARAGLGLHESTTRFPLARSCQAIFSRCINAALPLAEVLERHHPWCADHHDALQALAQAYAKAKQAQRLMDYDDLLQLLALALQQPGMAPAMGARFSHVLVDEMQDTNALQAAILHALKPDGRGLTVVGDDAQAIYGFRAADVTHLLDLPQRFTPPAAVRLLTRNYRSTQPLLAAADAVIAQAGRRFAKTLWSDRVSSQRPQLVLVDDEAEQAAWVATQVLRQREEGTALKRQAVLFRTATHSAALELELARRRIPFVKYGGLRFLEAAHVKDLLALLRWMHNPRARLAGWRVLRLVGGIGAARATTVLDAMDASAEPLQVLWQWQPPPRARADWQAWLDAAAPLRSDGPADTAPAPRWPQALQPAIAWLRAQLPRLYGDDAPTRALDLEQLGLLAAGHANAERFLTELALDPPQATSDEAGVPHRDDDYLILSTIHSAKGQEWHSVHVLNVVDGCMPADMATGSAAEIDEERRLLYVAMTRARDRLHLLVPQRFHVTQQRARGDRHLYAARTRFIPDSIEPLFERVVPQAAAEAPAAGALQAAEPPPAVDLWALAARRGPLPGRMP